MKFLLRVIVVSLFVLQTDGPAAPLGAAVDECRNYSRLNNDPLFIIEGGGTWYLSLNTRRSSPVYKRLPRGPYRSTPRGERRLFFQPPFTGSVVYEGSQMQAIYVVLPDKPAGYTSCAGLDEIKLRKQSDQAGWLKKLYSRFGHFGRSEKGGNWLYFPCMGIGWYMPNGRVKGFKIFRPWPCNRPFPVSLFYNEKLY